MFKTVIFKPIQQEILEHSTVSGAITYISSQLDLGIVHTGLVEYEEVVIALVHREPNLTIIKVYNSKLVTNNLSLKLSTPIKFEVVPNKNAFQSVFTNVTVEGSISLGNLEQTN